MSDELRKAAEAELKSYLDGYEDSLRDSLEAGLSPSEDREKTSKE